jgi:Flp pilus assembly protein TadG
MIGASSRRSQAVLRAFAATVRRVRRDQRGGIMVLSAIMIPFFCY